MKKEHANKALYRVIEVAFGLLLLFTVAFFVTDLIKYERADQISVRCEEIGGWTRVYTDGTGESVTLPCSISDSAGETIVIEAVLPDSIQDDTWISMFNGRDTDIYIGDKLVREFRRNEKTIIGGAVKSYHMFMMLTHEDAGKVLRIERKDYIDNGNISPVYIGSSLGLIERIINDNLAFFFLSVALIIIAVLSILIGFVVQIRYKVNTPIIAVGLGVLIVGLWLLADSELYQFAFRDYYIDGVVSYMLLLLIPYPFLAYVNSLQNGRYSYEYLASAIVLEVEFVVFTLLHCLNIASYLETTNWIMIIEATAAVVAIKNLGIDLYNKKYREYRLSFLGLSGFVIMCIIEMFLIAFVEQRQDGACILIGLYWMLVMAIIHQLLSVKEAQKQSEMAKLASEAKSNFLANMSHEIRTPMNAIVGMDEMILREAAGNARITKYAMDIKNAGKVLLSIINDILDLTKIESGKAELVEVDYELAAVINETVNLTRKKAYDKGLDYRVNIDEDIPSVLYGDELRIRQILMNIINNGIKYTEKGSVSLDVTYQKIQSDKLELIMTVTDTGIGIRDEDKDKLFSSFGRLEETRNRNFEGAGLGLHIAGNYVDMMNGRIEVESEYGSGSTFTVHVPQYIVSATPLGKYSNKEAEYEEGEYVPSVFAPDARILVVDDNELNLEVLASLLECTRAKVDVAVSGEECLKMFDKNRYNIVLLDQMMPGMDGISTLMALQAEYDMKNIPVIAVTADAVIGAREYYISKGFDDYLSKPVDAQTLEHMLANHLPKELVMTVEEFRREAEMTEIENGARKRVVVINDDSSELQEQKNKIDIIYKGVYVLGEDKAERYLEKHDADYVMIKSSEYKRLMAIEDKGDRV